MVATQIKFDVHDNMTMEILFQLVVKFVKHILRGKL